MAFSFGGTSPALSAAGASAQSGTDLEDIQTENLGWLALNGESKLQLLPTAWPSDQLPPPTASLMSIASHKGLVAAAGPNTVILATTESVRKAFEGPPSGDGNLKPFRPQLALPMPMRISQLAFTADESYLVLAAEVGGGLAVYDVPLLLQGSTQSAFELSTNGQALRALVPNPTAEKGEFLALVTNDGNFMMANLKTRLFNTGPNGQVLKGGVSCISWSTKGKQLVAGLANGTAYQMTPEGDGKAEIPRPPAADSGDHVSSISWLENHCFLMVLTPSPTDSNFAPPSTFFVVHRDAANQSNFIFQKITDPAGSFGMNRSPPHHFLLRLRDFPPNLQDVLVVASTASNDIGLFSRSKVPLTNTKPADKVTGVFTMTEMSDDSRRAQLPMSAELNDTSPIGLAFDLSSKEKVHKPIPTYEEINESATPLPALMVLNNEGVLASWWFIYSDSIRQSTMYSGLVAAGAVKPISNASPAPAQPSTPNFGASPKPAFGAESGAFGTVSASPSHFGAPAVSSTFGGASATSSAFGSSTTPGAFGGPSALGQSKSPWGTPAAGNAAPASTGVFGGSSTLGQSKSPWGTSAMTTTALSSNPSTNTAFGSPSFGQTSVPSLGLGNKTSPWTTGTTAPNASFGQSGGIQKPASPFGSSSTPQNGPPAAGFAAFATRGGFTAAPTASGSIFGASAKSDQSPFSKSTSSVFSKSVVSTSNPFGSPSTSTSSIFGAPTGASKSSGLGGPFVLGSTFKNDPSMSNDNEPTNGSKGSLFGANFGGALNETIIQPVVPQTNDAEMIADDISKQEPAKAESSTPTTTPAAPKTTNIPLSTPKSIGLFGLPSTSSGPAAAKPVTAGFSFGKPPSESAKPGGFFASLNQSTGPAATKTPATTSVTANPFAKPLLSPKIKQEPAPDIPSIQEMPKAPSPPGLSSQTSISKLPEAPLPPDATSKTSYDNGESSTSSSIGADAPLPPDFITKPVPPKSEPSLSLVPEKKPIPTDLIPPSDVPGGPEDDGESSGFLTEDDEDDDESEEGSGEDVAKDLSPLSETRPTPGYTPESSFGGPKVRASESSVFGQPLRPVPQAQHRSLFGEVSPAVPFLPPPPPKSQQSPRSPSPIRSAIPPRMGRPDSFRSVSAPGAASQIPGNQRNDGRSAVQVHPKSSSFQLSLQQRQDEERHRAESRVRKEAEETRALDDEEDDRMQQHLSSDIVPTKILDEFEAHANYVNSEPTESIQAQVETVYRDINAMIDTLGLNARSLQSFIRGHTELYNDEGRTRRDLEEDDDWCLVEIEDLTVIVESELARELHSGRAKDVPSKLETCNSLQKDIGRLRAKHEDVKKIFDALRDLNQQATARAQPLGSEQLAQQNDLRRDFTTFQKLLSEAEEGLMVLKAKIVSQTASQGKIGGAGPSVEAVMRTITKMTSMAEKRSGDIDVLEGQMRKLRFGSTASVGSREGSPFATPQRSHRGSVRNPGPGSYGLFYTPDNMKETSQRFQSSVLSSTSSFGRSISPRKKSSGYTAEEKMFLRTKLTRKKEATDKLRAALAKTGTHVRTMDG